MQSVQCAQKLLHKRKSLLTCRCVTSDTKQPRCRHLQLLTPSFLVHALSWSTRAEHGKPIYKNNIVKGLLLERVSRLPYWNCLFNRWDSFLWLGNKCSITHFNVNDRIRPTHLRSSQLMFPTVQHYSHSRLLESHSELYADFPMTHPTSEGFSALHD